MHARTYQRERLSPADRSQKMAQTAAALGGRHPLSMAAEERLRELERLVVQRGTAEEEWLSIESLLDVLLCLYQECNSSPPLRRDKNVADFLRWGEPGRGN